MSLMRRFLLALPILALAIAFVGCASNDDQQAQQAEASAAKAQQAAEHAEQAAAQAQAAADKATEAANRATAAVQDATREINRVGDHLDQMEKDREAAHGRRLSHVTKSARKTAANKTAVASGAAADSSATEAPAAAPSPK
jgi:trimeric autotransporter adhesin